MLSSILTFSLLIYMSANLKLVSKLIVIYKCNYVYEYVQRVFELSRLKRRERKDVQTILKFSVDGDGDGDGVEKEVI